MIINQPLGWQMFANMLFERDDAVGIKYKNTFHIFGGRHISYNWASESVQWSMFRQRGYIVHMLDIQICYK